MFMFLCDYPVKFPRSEYGGMVAVIAESPKHCGKILTERYGHHGPYFDLRIAINSFKKFPLDPNKTYNIGVVYDFIT